MKRGKHSLVLMTVMLIGLVLGGLIGKLLEAEIPLLAYGKTLGMSTTVLDLLIIKVTFGFSFTINIASIIGLLIAFFIYRRL